MAALVGVQILGVAGSDERGFVVSYQGPDGDVRQAIVPPDPEHPDFVIATRFKQGVRAIDAGTVWN